MEKLKPWTKVRIINNKSWHNLKIWNIYYIRDFNYYNSDNKENVYNIEWWLAWEKEFELVEDTNTFKVWDVIKFKTGNTKYVIVEVLNTEYKYKHLWNCKVFWCNKNSYIELLDKTYEDYVNIKEKCLFILDTPEWKEWIKDNLWYSNTWTWTIKNELLNHVSSAFAYALESTLSWTNTWCIDYAISYLDTSTCTTNKQWEIQNTLLTNNNTMEKLNQLRADKFFANEKNLVEIETLDTLLKDSAELIAATEIELNKIKLKLNWLSRKLEAATNTQDVAMLKDLIASTKVVQEFVDELKDKTISKFETAKTKFDIVGYLKD